MANQNQQFAADEFQNELLEKKYPYFYYGAVNRRVDPFDMKDTELLDSVNFWTERAVGAKKVRPGYNQFLDRIDNNPVKGLFYVKFSNGSKRLVRLSGGNLYAIDPNNDNSFGSPLLVLPNNDMWIYPSYTVLNGRIHIVSQINSIADSYYIEGTGMDVYTNTDYEADADLDLVIPYRGNSVQQYQGRVYTTSPYYFPDTFSSQLSWSTVEYDDEYELLQSPYTPWSSIDNDISTANFTPVDLDYHGAAIKLTSINGLLLVYKEEGIYSVNSNQSLLPIFNLSPLKGSIATIQEMNLDVFLTNEGFFKTDGQNTTPAGDGWYPIIKQIFENGFSPTVIHSAAVNFLYFCYVGDITYDNNTVHNACFVYNAIYDELTLWSFGHNITAIGYYVDNNQNKIIVLGDDNGFVYSIDYSDATNSDAGVAIQAYMRSKYFFFDEPHKYNHINQVYGFATLGSEMQVAAAKDFSPDYNSLCDINGIDTKQRIELSKFGAFKNLGLRIMWNGKGVRPEFYGAILSILQDSERVYKSGRSTSK